MISRRSFIILAGGAVLAPSLAWPEDEVPALLDHILLACDDLGRGITFVADHTGIRPAFGGVHPGRGTQNALLSLGERHYLEIIAPDPKQTTVQPFAAEMLKMIKESATPRLIGWAAHPGEIDAFAKKLGAAKISFNGPYPGSRARPDGHTLRWKTIHLADDHQGMLPFFIEWSADSVHPSADAPHGCRLERFAIADPDPAALKASLKRLNLDVPVERGERLQLRARVRGPRGAVDLNS